jgi:pimeloyl-ACP methyl ester carboxylesterase
MVLVEAGADNPWRMMPDRKLVRASELATGKPLPALNTSTPLRESEIPPGALSQIKAAAQEAVPHANEPPRDKLPIEAQRMRTWALGQVKHYAAAVNPFEAEELASLRAERAKSEHPLGEMPLIVLTRGISEQSAPDSKTFEEEHKKDHAELAKLSKNGKIIIAAHSGHHVQLDEPELVVQSIREVITAARKANSSQLFRLSSQTPRAAWR